MPIKLSIVATLYQSAPYITEFHQRASAAAKQLVGEDYEIVLVNDGSPDNSLDIAVQLTENDSHVVVVDLSRNFGHHKAMLTGLSHANGEQIFLIDSDLEEDPGWINDFANIMNKESCDVVYGVQEKRKGSFFEQWSGHFFYKFFNYLSDIKIPTNQTVARLMSARYVNAILKYEEREVFLGGIMTLAGFEQKPYKVKKLTNDTTTYTLWKRISQSIDAVFAFSNRPLHFISLGGLFISTLSFIYILHLTYAWLTDDKITIGWTSVVASIWLASGLIMSSIGIIGIYITKLYSETKGRPRTIVRSIYKNKKLSPDISV